MSQMSRRTKYTPAPQLLGLKGYHETVRVPQIAQERQRRREEERKREAEAAAKLPWAVCESCHRGYGMKPTCPYYAETVAERKRDPRFQYPVSSYECPICVRSHLCLGTFNCTDLYDCDIDHIERRRERIKKEEPDTPRRAQTLAELDQRIKQLTMTRNRELREYMSEIKAGEAVTNTLITLTPEPY